LWFEYPWAASGRITMKGTVLVSGISSRGSMEKKKEVPTIISKRGRSKKNERIGIWQGGRTLRNRNPARQKKGGKVLHKSDYAEE